jgi:hypothetical protein
VHKTKDEEPRIAYFKFGFSFAVSIEDAPMKAKKSHKQNMDQK